MSQKRLNDDLFPIIKTPYGDIQILRYFEFQTLKLLYKKGELFSSLLNRSIETHRDKSDAENVRLKMDFMKNNLAKNGFIEIVEKPRSNSEAYKFGGEIRRGVPFRVYILKERKVFTKIFSLLKTIDYIGTDLFQHWTIDILAAIARIEEANKGLCKLEDIIKSCVFDNRANLLSGDFYDKRPNILLDKNLLEVALIPSAVKGQDRANYHVTQKGIEVLLVWVEVTKLLQSFKTTE